MPAIRYQVTIDDSGAVTHLQKMGEEGERAGKRTGEGAKIAHASLAKVKEIVAGLGLSFGALGAAQWAREQATHLVGLQTAMAEVHTIVDTTTKAGVEQFAKMRAEIGRLPAELGDAINLTKGLYEALSAGIEPGKAVMFVAEAAKFAKAALTDTFTAVDVMTTIMNAYGLSVDKAASVTSVLFKAIELGKTRGPELGAALGRVVPIAAALKVPLEEVSAALVVMTLVGLSTDEAVTALRQVLVSILDPTKQAEDAIRMLSGQGTSAGIGFKQIREELTTKGLVATMGRLAEVVRGDNDAAAMLFGNVRALLGVLALTGAQSEKYADTLRVLTKTKTDATAVDVAFAKQMNTTSAQMDALGVNVNRLIKGFVGVDGVTGALKGANKELERMLQLLPEIKIGLAAFAATVVVMKFGIVSWVLALGSATVGLKALWVALIAPAGALATITVIGALAASFAVLGYEVYKTVGAWQEADRSTVGFERSVEKAAQVLKDKYHIEISKAGITGKQYTQMVLSTIRAVMQLPDAQVAAGDAATAAAAKHRKSAEEIRAAMEAVKAHRKELEKLQEALYASLHPADNLALAIKDLREVGTTTTDIIRGYGDQILAATARHRELKEAIPESVRELAILKAEADLTDFYVQLGGITLRLRDELIPELKKLANALESIPSAADVWLQKEKEVADTFHTLGLKTKQELAVIALETKRAYEDSGLAAETGSQRELTARVEMLKAQKEAIIAAGDTWTREQERSLRRAEIDLEKYADRTKYTFQDWAKFAVQQVSTIFTDMSKGIAEAIVHWKGFGETLKRIFQDIAVAMIRFVLEMALEPILNKIKEIIYTVSAKPAGAGAGGGTGASPWMSVAGAFMGGLAGSSAYGGSQAGGGMIFSNLPGIGGAGEVLGRYPGGATAAGGASGGGAAGSPLGALFSLFKSHPYSSLAIGAGLAIIGATYGRGRLVGSLGGMAGGALTGAGIGSMIMPGIGTLIGAGIGALVGGVAGFFGGGAGKEKRAAADIADQGFADIRTIFEEYRAHQRAYGLALAEMNKVWTGMVQAWRAIPKGIGDRSIQDQSRYYNQYLDQMRTIEAARQGRSVSSAFGLPEFQSGGWTGSGGIAIVHPREMVVNEAAVRSIGRENLERANAVPSLLPSPGGDEYVFIRAKASDIGDILSGDPSALERPIFGMLRRKAGPASRSLSRR